MNQSRSRIVPLTAGLAATALMVAACGVDIRSGSDTDDGPTVTESFEIDDFDRLVVRDSWTVFVTLGSETTLEVEVAEDLLDDVQVDQSGDRLTLSLDDPRWFSSHRGTREARITTPNLTELDVEGASTVEVVGLTGDQLDVELSGAATVDLGEVELQQLQVALEGASSIDGAGSVGVLTADSVGASSVNFGRMTIDEAEIDASGASSLDLGGASAVSGRLAGASSVDVADDASVTVRTSGASSVD
ncbi:MAG: DUF2807 domain-containing protein [Acidimicrobiia bacterium]|nr:DUF2807 domain-containing protein [Acidimicrobiia bacterium]